MLSGMSKEEFIQEYYDKGWLTNAFINKFSNELDYSPSEDAKKELSEVTQIVSDASVKAADIFNKGLELNIEPKIDNDELKKEVNTSLATLGDFDNKFGLYVEPDVELSDDAKDYIQMIQNAVNSGLGMEEINGALTQGYEMYGIGTYLEALTYIEQLIEGYKELQSLSSIDEYSGPRTNGSTLTPWRTTGANGMSDSWNKGGMNYINRQNATGEQEATTIDYDQMAGSVKSGATSANAGVIDELQTIIQRLNSLLAKEWKVNINPTSTMGAMNSAAAAAWGKVNG
jgi:hypothetical protein